MAARSAAQRKRYNSQKDTTAWTPDKVRQRMRTTALVNRLIAHALGKVDMPASAVTAALGLLKKALPDLAAVEHSGEVIQHYVAEVPGTAPDAQAWSKQHAPRLQ